MTLPKLVGPLTSPRVNVRVTQKLIDTSIPKDSSHCMIADAVQTAVPKARFISVDLATIRFTDLNAGRRYIYLTPRAAQIALLKFDQGEQVEPFDIRLDNAHVLATGSARNARASLQPQTKGSTHPPERRDGQAPPLGPLVGGAPKQRRNRGVQGAGAGNRTGRRREFGLRAIIR